MSQHTIPDGLTPTIEQSLRKGIKTYTNDALAKWLGLDKAVLQEYLEYLGLARPRSRCIRKPSKLTQYQKNYIIEHYARTMTRDVAKVLGLTERQVYDYAKLNNISKDKRYLVEQGSYRRGSSYNKAKAPSYKSTLSGDLIYECGVWSVHRSTEIVLGSSVTRYYIACEGRLRCTSMHHDTAIRISRYPKLLESL